ncbi:DEAD/DEAH box helicase [Bifidobacterium leontopitheci]|nr:DEAD/DEAH box helicase [Bifidobacterium leontopitheci]
MAALGDRAENTPAAALAVGDAEAPTFAELGVPGPLVRVLAQDDKTRAFPIQADTLADSLAGRDLLGRGQTGSGKTLAFAIPLVARLSERSVTEVAMEDFEEERRRKKSGKDGKASAGLPHPRGLVLAPTRELVNQIDEVIAPLAQAYGMTTVTVYGGVSQNRQVKGLRAGADIVVACPGRLEDLLRQKLLTLESVEVVVLDEADEMADMGFLPPVTRLMEQVDPKGQKMLFSATLDHGVDELVNRFLPDAVVHAVDAVDAHVDTMTHHVFEVSQGNKHEVIRLLASGKSKRILFTRTKFQAKKMAKKLVEQGIPAVDLQGNLSQKQRDRNLAAFENGLVRVLVATDVAARGIDVHDVALVVQTEPPEDEKSFLHRSGRTARAGETGDVVTLVLPNQTRKTRRMMSRAGLKVRSVEITPASPQLLDLVGETVPTVEGWSLEQALKEKAAADRAAAKAARAAKSGKSGRRSAGRSNRRDDRFDGGNPRYNRAEAQPAVVEEKRRKGGKKRGRYADVYADDDQNTPLVPLAEHERDSAQYRFDHRGEERVSFISDDVARAARGGYGKRRHTTKRDRFERDGRNADRRDDRFGGRGGRRHDDLRGGRDEFRGGSRRDDRNSSGYESEGKRRGGAGDGRRSSHRNVRAAQPSRKAAGFRKGHGKRSAAPFRRGR